MQLHWYNLETSSFDFKQTYEINQVSIIHFRNKTNIIDVVKS